MPTVPTVSLHAGTRRAVDAAMSGLGSLLELFQRLECEVSTADSSAATAEAPLRRPMDCPQLGITGRPGC